MSTWAGRAEAMDEFGSSPNLYISDRLYNLGVSESEYTAEQHITTVEQHNQPVLEHTQNLKSAMILLCWLLVSLSTEPICRRLIVRGSLRMSHF